MFREISKIANLCLLFLFFDRTTHSNLPVPSADFLQERLSTVNQSNYDELLALIDELLQLPENEQNRACEQLVKQEFLENQLNKVVSNPDAKLLEFIANSCKNCRFSVCFSMYFLGCLLVCHRCAFWCLSCVPFDVPLSMYLSMYLSSIPLDVPLLVCLSLHTFWYAFHLCLSCIPFDVSFILPSLVSGNTISNTKGYPCQSRRDKAAGYR